MGETEIISGLLFIILSIGNLYRTMKNPVRYNIILTLFFLFAGSIMIILAFY
jgi:hypothetical protein